ncbi:MAG: nucleotide exchange factor GrpE [Candidatus Electryoneaceae bacterium]|nr:nucleotide exchange factor GrpE [Candidatus Electryoneaceae bacterium]
MTEDKTKNDTEKIIQEDSSSKDDKSVDVSEDIKGKENGEEAQISPVDMEEIVKRSLGNLDEILKGLTDKIASEKEKRMRLMAEYENYRRRTQANFQKIIRESVERIILKLLPVLDDFERLFENDPYQVDCKTMLKGADLIYRKLLEQLEAEGLQPIESHGQPFDVNLHEAISEKEDKMIPPGIIVSEVEKGYYLKDKVIRHSKVIVSRASDNMDDGEWNG